ncbi:uncharacterized protein CLUP02_00621 [Colletotrichum lupini]|uniref:Uncharacterized protein n=1 Tax=Colletotrichum lupini TaxID=145971 RepID=A0A9Q8W8D0_9PEZI|nr:uncharacterized protein CLUP02_00621 [Colletotrichum lupini]UQC73974.1 hypothetical protein CLUP02_00621 [Colletotrichum lupini]
MLSLRGIRDWGLPDRTDQRGFSLLFYALRVRTVGAAQVYQMDWESGEENSKPDHRHYMKEVSDESVVVGGMDNVMVTFESKPIRPPPRVFPLFFIRDCAPSAPSASQDGNLNPLAKRGLAQVASAFSETTTTT